MAIGGRLLAQTLYVLSVLSLVPIAVRETSVYRASLPATDRFAGTAMRPGALCVLLAGASPSERVRHAFAAGLNDSLPLDAPRLTVSLGGGDGECGTTTGLQCATLTVTLECGVSAAHLAVDSECGAHGVVRCGGPSGDAPEANAVRALGNAYAAHVIAPASVARRPHAPLRELRVTLLAESASLRAPLASAVEQHLRPTLSRLRHFSEFWLRSQTAALAFDGAVGSALEFHTAAVPPADAAACEGAPADASGRRRYFWARDMSAAFTLIENELGPGITAPRVNAPAIGTATRSLHLVLLMAPREASPPIYVREQSSGACEWHASALLPTRAHDDVLVAVANRAEGMDDQQALARALESSAALLRVTLGLRPAGAPEASDEPVVHDALSRPVTLTFASPRNGSVLADWEIDALTRASLVAHTSAALNALDVTARLARSISAISISDSAAAAAARAARNVAAVYEALVVEPASLDEAAIAARHAAVAGAELLADRDTVPMAHFPAEHLFAIFAPLLLPLLVPLFYGWVQEYQRARDKGRALNTPYGRAVPQRARAAREDGVAQHRLVDWELAGGRPVFLYAPVDIGDGGRL